MKHLLTMTTLSFLFLTSCNFSRTKTNKTENATQTKKTPPPIKETNDSIPYEVNEDYLTDDEYPFRIENENISSMVFHYTAQSYKKSLRSLTTGGNSSHWLVPSNGATVYKIVNENRRARHAGASLWKNRKNVNVISVGIEIVNLGFKCKNYRKYCNKDALEWIGFPEKQQKLIISLAKDIQKRYNIDPLCVVGHSDVAVDRKLDPGPLFPWKKLANNGVGAWATEEEIQVQMENIKKSLTGKISPFIIQIRLFEFGYDIRLNNVTNKKLTNKLLKYEYNLNKTRISDISALQIANDFGNKKEKNDIFDLKKTNFAIHSFLMHYLPDEYLNHRIKEDEKFSDNHSKHDTEHTPDSKSDYKSSMNDLNKDFDSLKLLATLQALLIKFPDKVRTGCNF